jgi:hypothetical protein
MKTISTSNLNYTYTMEELIIKQQEWEKKSNIVQFAQKENKQEFFQNDFIDLFLL